ncbi:plasminogen-binding protein pgbB [Geopyxis carbonaria]|nr:plasminogen-binding protein pgbB [Geopyxis carbonaria]
MHLLPALTLAAVAAGTPLRLLTWNLRYDSLPDSIPLSTSIASLPAAIPADTSIPYYPSPAEAPWSTRRIGVARTLAATAPDLIAVQEALSRQVADLSALLPSYTRLGVGRDDGVDAGEFSAIYFRPSPALKLQSWDTFWLSPTPSVPSRFPGAGSTRTATVARFAACTVLCTHWDDQSDAQRRLAASLIRYRAAYEAATTRRPVFVLGDFNSPSDGDDSGGYAILTGHAEPVEIEAGFREQYRVDGMGGWQDQWGMADVAAETPPIGRSGHHATFTGFKRWGEMDLKRIDFVMAGVPPGVQNGTLGGRVSQGAGRGWRGVRYSVGETWFDDEPMHSDHRPVWVDVVVGGKY